MPNWQFCYSSWAFTLTYRVIKYAEETTWEILIMSILQWRHRFLWLSSVKLSIFHFLNNALHSILSNESLHWCQRSADAMKRLPAVVEVGAWVAAALKIGMLVQRWCFEQQKQVHWKPVQAVELLALQQPWPTAAHAHCNLPDFPPRKVLEDTSNCFLISAGQ